MKNKIYNILVILNIIVVGINIYIIVKPTNYHCRTYCQSSVNCGECIDNTMVCHYYDDNMTISNDTINCDCSMEDK